MLRPPAALEPAASSVTVLPAVGAAGATLKFALGGATALTPSVVLVLPVTPAESA